MVKLRRVRHNKGRGVPGSIVCLDTETFTEQGPRNTEKHQLRIGVAKSFRIERGRTTRRQEIVFQKADDFWNWLSSRVSWQRPTWIFAHNIGFDLRILGVKAAIQLGHLTFRYRYLRKGKVCVATGFCCDEDPPTIINGFLNGCGRVIFVDTMNWFRSSLEDVGESVGLEKPAFPGFDAGLSTTLAYCRNDVEIVEKAVCGLVRWVKENDLGVFRSTAPAQARAAWRHRFYTHPVETHDDKQVRKLERDCYYSGRVQIFHAGKLDVRIHELDACGAYVSVLHDCDFPVRLIRSSESSSPGHCPVLNNPLSCAAGVTIETGDQYPYRTEKGEVWWATGCFQTTLAGPELQRAVAAGDVKSIHRWSYYRLKPAFREFAGWTWDERMKYEAAGDTLYAELAKLTGNSFYGKWGQRGSKWVDTDHRADLEPFERRWVSTDDRPQGTLFRSLGDVNQMYVQEDEHPHAFPAIAAWCTAYLRERLRTWIGVAGVHDVPYVCCDAIYTTDVGFRKLWTGGWVGERKLGLLEHRKTATSADFLGCNNIRFGNTIKASGVKRDCPPEPDGRYKSTIFESFSVGAARSDPSGVYAQTRLVRLPKAQIRGEVQRDGSVQPMRLCHDRQP